MDRGKLQTAIEYILKEYFPEPEEAEEYADSLVEYIYNSDYSDDPSEDRDLMESLVEEAAWDILPEEHDGQVIGVEVCDYLEEIGYFALEEDEE